MNRGVWLVFVSILCLLPLTFGATVSNLTAVATDSLFLVGDEVNVTFTIYDGIILNTTDILSPFHCEE